MALAIADALIENDGNWNPTDTMDNFLDWYQSGKYSCIDRCFDIGNTCRNALHRYMMDPATPYQGDTDPQTSGNGALMRMFPVIMVASSLEEATELAVNQTKLTHGMTYAFATQRHLHTICSLVVNLLTKEQTSRWI